ncbi:AraC family transcriptional regulator, partial [Paenibacillus sp. IHB B 3415]|uniref:AraC family transcriptional regulator n=1 Tax=Paenibacillus sp. IHB B 3415 TaxID=867080 RepID=UPI00062E6B53
MNLDDQIKGWNHASIKIMDIRSGRLNAGSEIPFYQLPSSAFIFASLGHAQVQLDHRQTSLGRNQIIHGGRGAILQVTAEEAFEYFLVLYKAVLMLPSSSRFRAQIEQENPFRQQYTFGPSYPVPLLAKLGHMHQEWLTSDPLRQLHARSLFLQFVHELLLQMQQQGLEPVQPDPLAQVLRYMQEHYREPVTLDLLAELFDCSVSYLSKLFKSRMKASPIRVLTHIRMEKAADYLLQSGLTLQEVAERTGYPDAHTFSRNFKKRYGLPPALFKMKYGAEGHIPELPVFQRQFHNSKPLLGAV